MGRVIVDGERQAQQDFTDLILSDTPPAGLGATSKHPKRKPTHPIGLVLLCLMTENRQTRKFASPE